MTEAKKDIKLNIENYLNKGRFTNLILIGVIVILILIGLTF